MEIEITKIVAQHQNVDLRSTIDFGLLLNNVLKNLRMSHWYSNDYNIHQIIGNLYDSLEDLFDKLQEEIIGTVKLQKNNVSFPIFNVSQGVENLAEDYEHIERFFFYTELISSVLSSLAMKHYIEDTKPNGLNNTIEEILSSINKSHYLINMINLD
jgi:hypothetical protein